MNPADPFSEALRAWSALATALPGTGAGTPAPSPLDALLMQAHWASSASLTRSGQRGAQSWLDYAQAAAAQPELAQQVDAARAHLRRLAEIAADEARQTQAQMLAFDAQACALLEPLQPNPEPSPEPQRRAKAKP